jgi:glyoxylase-like metal-dependent hydrolase (beta-lactamase superfamily II)
MRRGIVLGILLAAGSVTLSVAAMQQAPAGQQAPRVVEVDKIKDNLYLMRGGGGNTAVFVTGSGVVVVDTKNPGWGQPLLEAIKKVTDRPVTTIVNTHTHGDHVSGNVEFAENVEVIAHENTAANMKAMRPNSSAAPNPNPPNIFRDNNGKGLPKRTFKDQLTIGSGADRIELRYFGRAHTDGDAVVYFPALRVAHVADIFPAKDLPIMDANNGGSGVEYADTLAKAATFTSANVDILINGHNDKPSTNADLKEFTQFVRDFVKAAQDAKRSGTAADAFAAGWKPPAGFTAREARVLSDAQLIYKETK